MSGDDGVADPPVQFAQRADVSRNDVTGGIRVDCARALRFPLISYCASAARNRPLTMIPIESLRTFGWSGLAGVVTFPLVRALSTVMFSIPSPSRNTIHLGPLKFNAYGMCIAAGVFAAVWLASHRWVSRGGSSDDMPAIAMWGVPAGVIGARLYHVATDWKDYRGRWGDTVKIWDGGLGIWGGVALGVIVGLEVGRRRGLRLPGLLECVAPAIPLAQAMGRVGNWFNIELFGGPSTLPWALEVPLRKRPAGYRNVTTFHPTFLYEIVWNLFVVGLVLVVEKRYGRRLKPGRLFAVYIAAYTFGRFWIERVRVDKAFRLLGLRINELVSGAVFLVAVAVILTGLRAGSPTDDRTDQTGDRDGGVHPDERSDEDVADLHDAAEVDQTAANPAQ